MHVLALCARTQPLPCTHALLRVIPGWLCPAGLEDAADPDDDQTIEYAFNLPDGVPSRFRYEWHEGQPLLRFRVPNRTVESNDDFALKACALRVASRFAAPHAVIEFTDEGKAAFLGYQTLLNVRANAAVKALVTKPTKYSIS